jgi:hypothetical protein
VKVISQGSSACCRTTHANGTIGKNETTVRVKSSAKGGTVMARWSDFGHEHMIPNSTSLVHVDDTVTCSVHSSPGSYFGSCNRSTKSSPENAGAYFNQGCQMVLGNSTRCATCFCHMSGQVNVSVVGSMVGVFDGTTVDDGSGVGAKDRVGSGVLVGAGLGTIVGPSLPKNHDGHGVGITVGFGVSVGCGVTVGWTVT